MSEISEIIDFFKHQTVFITGGSGFVGKILIEKLLRECPEVGKVYLLIRPKKGKTPNERFEEVFNFACFHRLKAENSSALKKVKLINGDCCQPQLGLGEQDVGILTKETTCVIHAAANVKFDQSLKEAAENVRGTKDVLELAKKMERLKVLVFVSTAYSNCIHSHVKEDFYEPAMKSEDLLAVVNSISPETLEAISPHLLKNYPNTYIFSKSISEDLVRSASADLPVAVVRPAIIMNTFAEPFPGWIDNIYGVVGIVLGAGLGVIKSLHAKLDAKSNLVPADYVANVILAAAWQRGTADSTIIYNYVGHRKSQLTWKGFMEMIEPHCWDAATEKVLWYYCFKLRENKTWHKICVFFLHTVLAYIVDFVLFCIGKPTLAVKNYQRLNRSLEMISYFTTREWNFDDRNVEELWKKMNAKDKKVFFFDTEDIDWDEWGHNSTFGARLHLLKDTPDTFDKGRRKIKILFVLHYSVVALFWFLVYKLVMFVLGFIF